MARLCVLVEVKTNPIWLKKYIFKKFTFVSKKNYFVSLKSISSCLVFIMQRCFFRILCLKKKSYIRKAYIKSIPYVSVLLTTILNFSTIIKNVNMLNETTPVIHHSYKKSCERCSITHQL